MTSLGTAQPERSCLKEDLDSEQGNCLDVCVVLARCYVEEQNEDSVNFNPIDTIQQMGTDPKLSCRFQTPTL